MIRLGAIVLLGALLGACADERQQECQPGRTDLCIDGETCAVDRQGTPICIPPGAAEEGDLCRLADGPESFEAAAHCEMALGCARISGVSRCVRFCTPGLEDDECQPRGLAPFVVGDSVQRLRQAARCAGVLPDRPEIGVCVLPCRPDRRAGCIEPDICAAFPDDCPDGTVCGVDPQAPIPVCVPAGDGAAGDACHGELGCRRGLLCARIDGASRCHLATNQVDTCPTGHRKVPLAGVDDPLVRTGEALEAVCVPEATDDP